MKAATPKRSLSADSVLAGVESSSIYNNNEVLEHNTEEDAWMIIKDKVRVSFTLARIPSCRSSGAGRHDGSVARRAADPPVGGTCREALLSLIVSCRTGIDIVCSD